MIGSFPNGCHMKSGPGYHRQPHFLNNLMEIEQGK